MSEAIGGEIRAIAQDNFERTVSGLKDGVATATASLEQGQATMREGVHKATRTAEDVFAFTQGNVEAMTRSGQIIAAGAQEMGQTAAAAARASLDDAMSTVKAMAAAKSVKEAFDLQAALLRSMVERTVSQTSQMTDKGMKLSEQAVAPVAARFSLAAQVFGRVG